MSEENYNTDSSAEVQVSSDAQENQGQVDKEENNGQRRRNNSGDTKTLAAFTSYQMKRRKLQYRFFCGSAGFFRRPGESRAGKQFSG